MTRFEVKVYIAEHSIIYMKTCCIGEIHIFTISSKSLRPVLTKHMCMNLLHSYVYHFCVSWAPMGTHNGVTKDNI